MAVDEAVQAYIKLCDDMMRAQVRFWRTGRYPVADAGEARKSVYDNAQAMTSYMVGLAISQFLWRTHYLMFSFFRDVVAEYPEPVENYLEVGPGHGLFLDSAIRNLRAEKMVAVEISGTSLALTRSLMEFLNPEAQVEYVLSDIFDFSSKDRFDFITMGEVLEHVNEPGRLLEKIRELAQGTVYVSTCVNAPAIDHVAHFHTVDEIRGLFMAAGFNIQREKVLPTENISYEAALENKTAINYCALLR